MTCRGVGTFKYLCGHQLSSFTPAVSKPQNPFPFEKFCQGEDDSLINHILSVSPLDNTRKCVHGLLLHQAAVVIHSTSTGTGRPVKPGLTLEMWRRAPFPWKSFSRSVSPIVFPQLKVCPALPQEACPPFTSRSRCLWWGQPCKAWMSKCVFRTHRGISWRPGSPGSGNTPFPPNPAPGGGRAPDEFLTVVGLFV